jgi:predicted AlkP superfamily pyrophosphatase or phosphodiesterase
MRIPLVVAVLCLLSACASSPSVSRDQTLILVSMDGFRADYLDRGVTPVISELARDGVRAQGMRPSFPSVTQPNHYTLVTGLRPDHHGIVDNTMLAADAPGFFGGPGNTTNNDPAWWNGATPLWVTAERHGVRTASMMWPGTSARVHDTPPTHVQGHDRTLTPDAEVDRVLQWLDLPAEQRPRLVLLYFGPVDDAGHTWGPDSAQVNEALGVVDSAIGRLVEGLRARNLLDRTNLVLTADHGMMNVSTEERLILIDDFVDVSKLRVTTYGAVIGVIPTAGNEAEVERAMLAPHEHLTCSRKQDISEHLHYGAHPRVPAIFCLAEPGWLVLTRAIGAMGQIAYPQGFRGNHGYDPVVPEMAAVFVAHGPAFRRGVVLPPFDNVDVYPMAASVLGVPPEPNDGDAEILASALR